MKSFYLFFSFLVIFSSSLIASNQENVDSLKEQINNSFDNNVKLKKYWELFNAQQALNPREGLDEMKKYNLLAIEHGTESDKANSFWAIAKINFKKGNLDASFENYVLSNKWYKIANNREQVANGLKNIGIIFQFVEEYDKAYSYYYDAIDIFKELKLESEEINTYRSISICKEKEGKFSEALKYADRGLQKAIASNDNKYINILYNRIGNTYYAMNNYEEARKMYFNSIAHYASLKKEVKVAAYAYNNIGETYMEQGDIEKAHEFFQMALVEKEKYGNKNVLGSTLLNIGKLYIQDNDPINAIRFLDRAITNLNKERINSNLISAIEAITLSYKIGVENNLVDNVSPMIEYNKLLTEQFARVQEQRIKLVQKHNQYMLEKSLETQELQASIGQLKSTKLYLIWGGIFIVCLFLFLIYLMNKALVKAQRKSFEVATTLHEMQKILGNSFQRMKEDDTFTVTTKK